MTVQGYREKLLYLQRLEYSQIQSGIPVGPYHQVKNSINPLVTNGISHVYQMDKSTFIFRGSGSDFSFLFHLSMKFM